MMNSTPSSVIDWNTTPNASDPFPVWISNMMNTDPSTTGSTTEDSFSILHSQIMNTTPSSTLVSSTPDLYALWNSNINNPKAESSNMAENESQMESSGIDGIHKSYKATEALAGNVE